MIEVARKPFNLSPFALIYALGVIPAEAGIQLLKFFRTPAFAGVTQQARNCP